MKNRRLVRSIIVTLALALTLGGSGLSVLAETSQAEQPAGQITFEASDAQLRAAHNALSSFYAVPGQAHDLPRLSPDEIKASLGKDLDATAPQPSKVIGEDERAPVPDTTVSPYRSIVYLRMDAEEWETPYRCSGSFIGPNTVLTAAHCLYDSENGFPDIVTVYPGLANSQTLPFGAADATTVWVTDEWVASGENTADYGIVILNNNNLGNAVGWLKIGALDSDTLKDPSFAFELAGYPADKDDLTPWTSSKIGFDTVRDAQLLHEIDTFNGQSGSAIWRQSDQTVIGIHNGFYTFSDGRTVNYGLRITEQVVDTLHAVCASLSCSVDELSQPGDPGEGSVDSQTAFTNTWARTDLPVLEGLAIRTWMWGEGPNTPVMQEEYAEAPGGIRDVQYYDKSRMEITDPSGDPNSIWYVTNGLLSTELISGNMQLGDNEFEQHKPAVINVAGDPDDIRGPTYFTFAQRLDDPPLAPGSIIIQGIDRAGGVEDIPDLAALGVPVAIVDDVTNHSIAGPFWQFMNSSGTVWDGQNYVTAQLFENAYFATGRPISEPYWTEVKVGGELKIVLVQCFERRCLTFTPQNSPEWQVEAGNVGQHYGFWRYELVPNENPVEQTPDVIYQSTMADWPVLLSPLGDYGVGVPASYHIFNAPTSFLSTFNGVQAADARMQVQVRRNATDIALSGTGEGSSNAGPDLSGILPDLENPSLGCLVYRAIPIPEAPIASSQSYNYCIIYNNDLVIGAGVVYFEADLDPTVGLTFGLDILDIWLFPQSLPQDTWLTLEVEAVGPQMTFYLDGQMLGAVEDNRLTAGEVGIFAFSGNVDGEGATDTEFRNIVVWQAGDQPDPGNGPPADTDLLLASDFSDWPVGEVDDGQGGVGGEVYYDQTYHMRLDSPDSFIPIMPTNELTDASYAVDIRPVVVELSGTEQNLGVGCLLFRSDTSEQAAWRYSYCLTTEGGTVSLYETAQEPVTLLEAVIRPETNPLSEWNRLKVVTKGNQLWFLLNGVEIGQATHNAHLQGGFGVMVINLGNGSSHFEFRDLEIYAVEGGAAQPPQPE